MAGSGAVPSLVQRPRAPAYKGKIANALVESAWPLLADGRMTPRIHAIFPLEGVREAHAVLDANFQLGKVVLAVNPTRAGDRPGAATPSKG